MEIKSRFSKCFYSNKLSKTKYNEIKDLALSINKVKNELSSIVNTNLMNYLDYSKMSFQKEALLLLGKDRINSNFIKQVSDDVFIAYQNKFDAVQDKLKFQIVYDYHFTFYKRNTKEHLKGDLKGISKKYKSTPLSITLTYLCRYGEVDTLERINKQLRLPDLLEDKRIFYQKILNSISKYGWNRLYDLAIQKRKRIIKKYSEIPIEFKSLTFRGRSRLSSDILNYNKNFKSVINSFINISWLERGEALSIPVKYSKSFHGDMKKYTNGTDTAFTIFFENKKDVKIILSFEDSRVIPENKSNFIGIDVNVKHNLMSCSDGTIITYDEKTLNAIIEELKQIDSFKEKNKEYKPSPKRTQKIQHLRRELLSKQRSSISDLCKSLRMKNIDHIVMEDLDGKFGKSFAKDSQNDVNYNRIVKELHISSMKDEVEHIARKYDICVSLTNPAYTSQTCPVCGAIDSENRLSQEEFCCIECGHTDNADLNASTNIKNRIVSTVIRDCLHVKQKYDNGTFLPRKFKHEKVKEILLSLRNTTCGVYPTC